MLITQVRLQLAQPRAVEVAEPAGVGPGGAVLQRVGPQGAGAPAGEGALLAAEDHARQVAGQLGPPQLDGNHSLLWGGVTDDRLQMIRYNFFLPNNDSKDKT